MYDLARIFIVRLDTVSVSVHNGREGASMSGLTAHIQRIPDWLKGFVDRCNGNLKYIVGVDCFPNIQGVETIGRTWVDNDGWYLDQGEHGADLWIDRFAPVYRDNPHVRRWIPINEVLLDDTPGRVENFNAFHIQFIMRMWKEFELLTACGQVNTGWLRLRKYGNTPPYPEALAPMLACLKHYNGWFTTHEYWPKGDATGNIGRFVDIRAELIAAGVTELPDFFISELGMDEQTTALPNDYNHQGWRILLKDLGMWPTYFSMIKGYSDLLAQYPWMRGACIFTEGGGWESFELDAEHAYALGDYIASDEPPPPPPPPDRARGIDVSQWQGDINWQAVADSGIEFVFMRASVGLRVDPYFAKNWQGAGDAGLLRGVYHYLEHDSTGQAKHFVNTVGERVPELGYWGDLEQAELTASKCAAFLEAVDRNLNYGDDTIRDCDVYTRASFFDKFGTPEWAAGRLLWVADWRDVDKPALPKAWDEWEFWQHTSDGAVPGIVGRVDLDVYAGTPEQLQSVYGNGEETYMDVKVFGYIEGEDGPQEEKTWDWLVKEFGPLDVRLAEPSKQDDGTMQVVRLVELREQYGPANCNVELFRIDGSPVKGINFAWHYSTAPLIKPTSPPTSRWEDNADIGPTNLEGVVGFSLSEDSYYYWPDRDEVGPYGCWCLAPGHPSDGIFGIGMIAGTPHRHLNLKFQVVITSDEPPPPPPPPPPVGSYRVSGLFGGIPVDLTIEPVEV